MDSSTSHFVENINMKDCSLTGTKGVNHVKKKKLVKIRKVIPVNNRSRIINTSFNSTLVKASLRSNNRALARALESKKQELFQAQLTILQQREKEQELMLELTTLREVAGLKNDNIEEQVNKRMQKRMAELHLVLQKVFASQVEFVEELTNAIEICGRPKRDSSVKNAMIPPKLANNVSLTRPQQKPMRVLNTSDNNKDRLSDGSEISATSSPAIDDSTDKPVDPPTPQSSIASLGSPPCSNNMPDLCVAAPDLSMIIEQSFLDLPFTDEPSAALHHSVPIKQLDSVADDDESVAAVERPCLGSGCRLSRSKNAAEESLTRGITGRSRSRTRTRTIDREDIVKSTGPSIDDCDVKVVASVEGSKDHDDVSNLTQPVPVPSPHGDDDIIKTKNNRKKSKQTEVERMDEKEETCKMISKRSKSKGKSLSLRTSKRSKQSTVVYSDDEDRSSERTKLDKKNTEKENLIKSPAAHERKEKTPDKFKSKPTDRQEALDIPKFISLIDCGMKNSDSTKKKKPLSAKKINPDNFTKKSKKCKSIEGKSGPNLDSECASSSAATSSSHCLSYPASPRVSAHKPVVHSPVNKLSTDRCGITVLPAPTDILASPDPVSDPAHKKNRRGTYCVQRVSKDRRGTYCLSKPVPSHEDVEDLMDQDDSILVNLSFDESGISPEEGDVPIVEDAMPPDVPESQDGVNESKHDEDRCIPVSQEIKKFDDFKVPVVPPLPLEVTTCEEEDMDLTETVQPIEKVPPPSFIRDSCEDEPSCLRDIPADDQSCNPTGLTESHVKPTAVDSKQVNTEAGQPEKLSKEKKGVKVKSMNSRLPIVTSKSRASKTAVTGDDTRRSRTRTCGKSIDYAELTINDDDLEARCSTGSEIEEDSNDKDVVFNKKKMKKHKSTKQEVSKAMTESLSDSEGERVHKKFSAYLTKPGKISFTTGRKNVDNIIQNHIGGRSRSQSRSTLPVANNRPPSKKARSKTRLINVYPDSNDSDTDSVFNFGSSKSKPTKSICDISLSDSIEGPKPSYSQYCGREMPHPKLDVAKETVAEAVVTDSPHGILLVLGNGTRTKPKPRARSKSVRYARRPVSANIAPVTEPDVTPPRGESVSSEDGVKPMSEDAGNTPIRRSARGVSPSHTTLSTKDKTKEAFCVPESPFVQELTKSCVKQSGVVSVGDSPEHLSKLRLSTDKEVLSQDDSPVVPTKLKRTWKKLDSTDDDLSDSIYKSPPIKKKKTSVKPAKASVPSSTSSKEKVSVESAANCLSPKTTQVSDKLHSSPVQKSLVISIQSLESVCASPKKGDTRDTEKMAKDKRSKSVTRKDNDDSDLKESDVAASKTKQSTERSHQRVEEQFTPTTNIKTEIISPTSSNTEAMSELGNETDMRGHAHSMKTKSGKSGSSAMSPRVLEIYNSSKSQETQRLTEPTVGSADDLGTRRRRAAAVSYKEPSLGGKMRRGDLGTSTIYKGVDVPASEKTSKDYLKAKKALRKKSFSKKGARKSSNCSRKRSALSSISNTIDSDNSQDS